VIIEIIGCVGNGDGVIVTGMNVDVGRGVCEATFGTDVSVDKATVCFPQATINRRKTIQKNRCDFVVIANLQY